MTRLLGKQGEYLEAIEWLISEEMDHRAVGRTELLCHAFILKAIKTGQPVRPFDHSRPWSFESNRLVNFPLRIAGLVAQDYSDYEMIWFEHNYEFLLTRKKNAQRQ